MRFFVFVVAVIFLALVTAEIKASEIEDLFVRHKVVKDVIGLSPPKLLKVSFDSGREVSTFFLCFKKSKRKKCNLGIFGEHLNSK